MIAKHGSTSIRCAVVARVPLAARVELTLIGLYLLRSLGVIKRVVGVTLDRTFSAPISHTQATIHTTTATHSHLHTSTLFTFIHNISDSHPHHFSLPFNANTTITLCKRPSLAAS
ncbi:hypothetical protein E2C01_097829 [Portunus trituberculatus]|uniref:Uncharacterized protein n=1 Tax=Portunus trituberculatus TaxID=210409 RepID=A0A5B7KAK2_PORTR|nr:hypothetical protein [Portunus trituberculatus]